MYMKYFNEAAFNILVALGRPFGGIRPRRIYHWLARGAHDSPSFSWIRDKWGNELFLSPYYLIDREIIFAGTYDLNLNLILEKLVKPGMICIDIGANIGEVSLHLGKLTSPHGRIYAIEAVRSVFGRLRENVTQNRLDGVVSCYNVAISKEKGTTTIKYADSSKENQGMGSLVDDELSVINKCGTVHTISIDEFLEEHNVEKIDLVKVDIQGAEPYLLEGGRRCFKTIGPDILMEVSSSLLQKTGKTPADLLAMIEDYGYKSFVVKRGRIKASIDSRTVSPLIEADNIFCTKTDAHVIKLS